MALSRIRGTGARRIVVVGDVINDVLVKPAETITPGSDTAAAIRACPGGSAANQAAWMAHLGAEAVFAGRVGARDAEYHRRELARAGVRAHLAADPDAGTGSIVIMVEQDGERTMFTDRGANLRLQRSDLPPGLLDGAAVLHLTGYTFCEPPLLELALGLLAEARSADIAVTIDPGSAAFLARMKAGAFLRWTDGAAVCFPNRDEAAVLTGEPPRTDPAAMAVRLTRHYGVVVLKLGAQGCVLAVPGLPPVRVPAHPAQATDTTGAGDAFCGAFMSRWLCRADLVGAAEYAVRIAAAVVTRFGARPETRRPPRTALTCNFMSTTFR